MAVLTAQQVSTGTGLINPTFAAATAGAGDTFVLNTRSWVEVKNGSGSGITVTLVVPGNTLDGQAIPDVTYSVPAGQNVYIGPFRQDHVGASGTINLTYSAVTTVTVALFAI